MVRSRTMLLPFFALGCVVHSRAPGDTSTYTVEFTMPVGDGAPVEFTLLIDGDDKGLVNNQITPNVIEVPGLEPGSHTIELRRIIFNRLRGVKDEPHHCSRIFYVDSNAPRQIWVKLLGSDVTCGVQ